MKEEKQKQGNTTPFKLKMQRLGGRGLEERGDDGKGKSDETTSADARPDKMTLPLCEFPQQKPCCSDCSEMKDNV